MDDGTTMDIDLSTVDEDGDNCVDASELVDAINHSDDNPGVSAALVKTDGTTTIMLTSNTTGEQSGFSVSVSGMPSIVSAEPYSMSCAASTGGLVSYDKNTIRLKI